LRRFTASFESFLLTVPPSDDNVYEQPLFEQVPTSGTKLIIKHFWH